MNWLTNKLDAPWKRLVAAAVLSGGIVLAVQGFAETTYVQTQKLQIESARGEQCQRWQYRKEAGETVVSCVRWPTPKSTWQQPGSAA